MPQTLIPSAGCCSDCSDTPITVDVPGPQGDPGADGADGQSAFTTTTASVTMPAYSSNVTVSVANSDWMTANQVVYLQGLGYFEVQNKPNSTSVVLKNLEDGAGAYSDNAAPTTVVTSGKALNCGGLQGPSGSMSGSAGGDHTGTYPNPTIGAGKVTTAKMAATGVGAVTKGSATTSVTITTDVSGRITALTESTISAAPTGSAGGDLTGTYPNPTLGVSGVTAGSYGSATQVPSLTVDAKGRLTAVSNTTITLPRAFMMKNVSGNYTVLLTDWVMLIDASSGPYTMSLPTAASAAGYEFVFKIVTGNGNITIDPNGAETIDGSATFALNGPNTNHCATIKSTGSAWIVTAKYT